MVGTLHGRHMASNLRALSLHLTPEDKAKLNGAVANLRDLQGDAFCLERIEDGPHSRII